jgi:hypothetical protein
MPLVRVLSKSVPASSGGGKVTSGLIAEYEFLEGAGQTVADGSGNSNPLELGSSSGSDGSDPTWISPVGLDFATAKYARPANALYSGDADHTAIYVVDHASGSAFRALYSQSDGGGSLGGRIYHYIDASNRLLSAFNQFNGPAQSASGPSAGINMLTFTHLKSSQTVQYFLNGAGVGSTVYTDNNVNVSAATPVLGGALANGYYHSRPMYYVAVYNRVLSSGELADMHNYIRALLATRGITIP